ncbi:MAG: T9SS C-terminal target domain-containing protein [Bacteroidetes bacterium]|nr:MAG: T9SS C-terminal target domain-containing protein [Bacteroidota bacterium]
MKSLYILIIFLVFAASGQSQETWGPPFPLTDSLTDNVNVTLSIVPGEFFQPDTLYMLWERSSDPLSTGIYARNLTTMAGPFMVAALLNVHFKHPRVFRRGTGDTLFYFSYETDMNGNWDLYYSIFMKNEVALGPFPFIRSALNERSLNFGDPQTFSWEKEGEIFVKDVTADTVRLASDSCSNPVQEASESYVAYEMATGPDLGVFYSKYNEFSHLWSGPFPMDIYGTNTHLTFGNDSFGTIWTPYVFWQHKNGPYWEVKGFDISSTQFCSFNNFPGCNNTSPSFCTINMTTDQDYLPNVDFFTFASDVTGNMEIYVNNWIYDSVYSILSEYSGIDTHPQLFNNFHISPSGLDNQLFDIWESYRGGHWQLWATTMDILTGENTLKGHDTQMIKSSPNPFTDETHIVYFTGEAGPVTVDIYDLRGKKIKNLSSASEGNGKYAATWDGKDAAGTPVPADIYVCVVKTGNTVLRCKIIRR